VPAVALLFAFAAQSANLNTPIIKLGSDASGQQIQEALDSLPNGGEVDLAPGRYVISQPITLRHDHQVLRGSGPSTVLYLADQANCPVILLGDALNRPSHTIMNVRVADLFIDGNRKNQNSELWRSAVDGSELMNNGVDIWRVNDVSVEHVTCCRCRSGGLVTSEIRRLDLSDFTAYDNQFDGLACYLTEESNFSKLHLHDNLAAGISLDLSFNHNTISDSELTGNDLGIFMRASRDNVFKGLTISHSRKDGVFMAQASGGLGLRAGTECTGNHFQGLDISACGRNAFLVNNASCTNNIIRDASFQDNVKGGLAEGDGKPLVVSLLLADSLAHDKKPDSAPVLETISEHTGTPAPKAISAVLVQHGPSDEDDLATP